MAEIIWAPRALEDLERLLNYIATDAPVAATRFAQRVIKRIEQLADHPESGNYVPEDDTLGYRQLLLGNYRIIYRVDKAVVYIIAIHHAARLLDADTLE